MRFKSSNSTIANNSVHNEGCHVSSSGAAVCNTNVNVNELQISYLQSWYEGAAFVENVTVENNRWYRTVAAPLSCDMQLPHNNGACDRYVAILSFQSHSPLLWGSCISQGCDSIQIS